MAGLDERMHDLVTAAGQEVAVPSPDGVRRRGTRRRVVRTGLGGLAVLLLAFGCVLGVRAAQGPDQADIQPMMTSDLPGALQIDIVPSGDETQDLKLIEEDGRLTVGATDGEGLHDLWSFPQPDPARKQYLIKMVSPGATAACVSTRTDSQSFVLLRPCDPEDNTQMFQIETEQGVATFRGLGRLLERTDPDLLTMLVSMEEGPQVTVTPEDYPEETATPTPW